MPCCHGQGVQISYNPLPLTYSKYNNVRGLGFTLASYCTVHDTKNFFPLASELLCYWDARISQRKMMVIPYYSNLV